MARGGDDGLTANAAAERMWPGHVRIVIWSSTSTMPCCVRSSISGGKQGLGFPSSLMYRVGAEAGVRSATPHDLRRHPGVDVVVGRRRAAFSVSNITNLPLRVGQRGGDRCQPYRMTGPSEAFCLAVAPRPDGGRIRACRRGPCRAAPEFWLSIAIVMAGLCHGFRTMAI